MGKMAPALAPERRTVYQMLKQAEATWGGAPSLHQPLGHGRYRAYSWVEYRRAAEEVAAGLRSLGVGVGDIVGLASETRFEFYIADIGAMTNGSIAAAVYNSLPAADQVRTFKACEPKAVFVENPKALHALDAAGLQDLHIPRIVLEGEAPEAIAFSSLLEMGRAAIAKDPSLPEKFAVEVQPSHYAILYLTSGATGEPKMGLVSHNAIVANCDVGPKAIQVDNDDSILVFLPSAHITQRLAAELLTIRMGVQVYFSEGLNRMPAELRTLRPTFFIAPPRVWERIYASITTEIRKKPAAIRKLFYLGLGFGYEASRARQEGRAPAPWVTGMLKFFDKAVFAQIRRRLGGRLRLPVSGAAPLGHDLAEFYSAIGMPLVEGYGLTEGGIVTLNPMDNPHSGSIGKPLPGIEIRLAADGELLIRSETLFSGYFKDPEATANVLRDGWLHTGDVATIDEAGYIWITGRKKELIVSSNGKKIFPARIESLFKLEPLVNQVLLIGDGLPYMTALITVNPAVAAGEAAQAEMNKIVRDVNSRLAPYERIRRFKILDRDFSLEAGELTPTMKLRRGKVLENFKNEINELYLGREEL